MTTMRVDQIKVGQRHRRDLGDVTALARDIDEIGLLQPVVVTPDGELIAGQRRIEAWKLSRFKDDPIPVRIVDIASIIRGEMSENLARKDFTPSEMVAIVRSMEASLRGEARERALRGTKATEGRARVYDVIGQLLGRDRKTLVKAKAVVEAAEKDPGRFGRLVEQMDASGKVDPTYKALNALRVVEVAAPSARQSIFDTVEIGNQALGDFTIASARHAAALLNYMLAHCERRGAENQAFREFVAASLVREALAAADASAEQRSV